MRIVRNTEGAVMLIAAFMAMVAIGALYYLAGLGDAIIAQERMQDAADATAFSSAVIHARGMNVLALLNLVMASVLAIVVLLSMLASVFNLGVGILSVAATIFPVASGGIPPLKSAAKAAKHAHGIAKPQVERVLHAAHAIQGPLNQMIPILANVNSMSLAVNSYRPVVSAAITFPIMKGMPTVDGTFDTLCLKAGALAGTLAMLPITATLDLVGSRSITRFISSPLKGVARRAGRKYAAYYCGDGSKPSPVTHTQKEQIPRLNSALAVACEKKEEGACAGYAEQLKRVRAAYNEERGVCDLGSAEDNRFCDQRRRRARQECKPGVGPVKGDVTFRETKLVRRFRRVGEGDTQRVIEEAAQIATPGKIKTKNAGVGTRRLPFYCRGPALASFTQTDLSPWDFDLDNPVCETEVDVPAVDDFRFGDSDLIEEPVREITDVLSCTQDTVLKLEISGETLDADAKKNTPREMCNCAALGEEMFQIRSIVKGDATALASNSSKAILVATQGRSVDQGAAAAVGAFAGGFAVAQAEYYFAGDAEKPALWLWEMSWKARLRRFRLPTDGQKWQCPLADNDNCPAGVLPALGGFSRYYEFIADGMNSAIVH